MQRKRPAAAARPLPARPSVPRASPPAPPQGECDAEVPEASRGAAACPGPPAGPRPPPPPGRPGTWPCAASPQLRGGCPGAQAGSLQVSRRADVPCMKCGLLQLSPWSPSTSPVHWSPPPPDLPAAPTTSSPCPLASAPSQGSCSHCQQPLALAWLAHCSP